MCMQKKFGQNFLINAHARRTLIEALDIKAGDSVWEIGPGLGAMTRELLALGAEVTAFEIDHGFCAALRELFADAPNFFLVEGDALKTWEAVAAQQHGKPAHLLGNLPYNIAATVIASFIERGQFFERIVVTVQKEVAMRIAAKPNQKDYSSLSVVCSSAYNVRPLSILKGEMFYPVPNVDSQSVLFSPPPSPIITHPLPPMFYPLVRALFAYRRKTVQNNLSVFLKASKALCADILQQAHIEPTARAENLTSRNFLELAALCPIISPQD